MARKINRTGDGDKEAPTAVVPKTRKKTSSKEVVFRSPHRELSVMIKEDKRVDHGAGSYSLTPPEMANFEDRGSYGEITCSPAMAEVLRQKTKEREAKHLGPKYVEV